MKKSISLFVWFSLIVSPLTIVTGQQAPQPNKGGIKINEKTVEKVQSDLKKRSKKNVPKLILQQSGSLQDIEAASENETMISALSLTPRDIDLNKAPWEMFASQLTNQIDPSGRWKGIQLVASPIAADWNDPKTGIWIANRVLGDTLPVWGNNYQNSSQQITKAYELFIRNLHIPQPNSNDQRKADKARDKYFKALDEVEKEISVQADRWIQFDRAQQSVPPQNRLSYTDWYQRFAGPKIAAKQQNATLAAQEFSHWIVAAGGGYASFANLIQNYDNTAFQVMAEDPNGLRLPYRAFNIRPNLNDFINTSKTIPASAAPALSFSFNKSSTRIDSSSTTMGAGFSIWAGWWSFGGGAGSTRETFDTSTDDFQMRFSAVNYQVFTITPGPWFDGTAVKALQDGPWFPDGPIATGRTLLWGSRGVFGLVPAQIVVAYKPKIFVKMSHSDYSRIKTAVNGSAGFSIGPFGFGASYRRETTRIEFNDSSNTITVEDTTDIPHIMAIVSNVLPNFE
jgi:hypothetical protein